MSNSKYGPEMINALDEMIAQIKKFDKKLYDINAHLYEKYNQTLFYDDVTHKLCESNGGKLQEELQIIMILAPLPDNFN